MSSIFRDRLFAGKTAFVSGGSSGIGLRIAERLAEAGASVMLNGRNGEGDRYYTDGEIRMAVLVVAGRPATGPLTELPPPPLVSLKDAIWGRATGAPAK